MPSSSSSRNFLKTSFKPILSSSKKSRTDNTYIMIIIAVLLFAIIAGVIIFNSSKNERFTNAPNKLIYLYMSECGFCKEFTPLWDEMTKVVNADATSKITMEKYDLNKEEEGKRLSTQNKIDYAPAILLITPSNNFLYEGERTKEAITKWVSTKV